MKVILYLYGEDHLDQSCMREHSMSFFVNVPKLWNCPLMYQPNVEKNLLIYSLSAQAVSCEDNTTAHYFGVWLIASALLTPAQNRLGAQPTTHCDLILVFSLPQMIHSIAISFILSSFQYANCQLFLLL